MELVWTIIIGFAVGLVARFLMPGKDKMGFILTTLLGIAGAVVARYLMRELGLAARSDLMRFGASVGGAVLLLFVYNLIRKRV